MFKKLEVLQCITKKKNMGDLPLLGFCVLPLFPPAVPELEPGGEQTLSSPEAEVAGGSQYAHMCVAHMYVTADWTVLTTARLAEAESV